PEAMGCNYEMEEKRGPVFPQPVSKESDLVRIRVADAGDREYVTHAITLTKKELNGRVPLIGFAGPPWTIFSYMIEGKGSKTFSEAKKVLYTNPEFAHKLLSMITASTANYQKAQVKAGADLIQVFDSWAGILSPEQYATFSLPYIAQLCDALQ